MGPARRRSSAVREKRRLGERRSMVAVARRLKAVTRQIFGRIFPWSMNSLLRKIPNFLRGKLDNPPFFWEVNHGKSTISMAIFNNDLFNYQRVRHGKWGLKLQCFGVGLFGDFTIKNRDEPWKPRQIRSNPSSFWRSNPSSGDFSPSKKRISPSNLLGDLGTKQDCKNLHDIHGDSTDFT